MGLDSVELVMAFEERFGIRIDDADAERLTTVRATIDYVCSVLPQAVDGPCLSQRAFHELRRELGPRLPLLRPSTATSALLQGGGRNAWQALAARLQLCALPELQRPAWFWNSMLVALPVAAVSLGLASGSVWWALIGSVVLTILAVRLSRPLATQVPAHCATVADLLRGNLRGPGPHAAWTREEVRASVRELVREQLGIRGDFSDDVRYVDDLGLD